MPKAEPKAKSFLCRRCSRKIRVPDGWSIGPATRRHYWRKHPEVMRPDQAKSQR